MKFLVERLQKVFGLPPGERFILAEAWVLFFAVELALRLLPFTRLLAICHRRAVKAGEDAKVVGSRSVARLAWLVEVAGRHVPLNATCLKQALVLAWILGRRGVPTELRIGVARRPGALAAHAWLEREGRVIFGSAATGGYEPLYPAG